MQITILTLFFSLLALASPVSAQSPSACPYKTNVVIYKDVKGGAIASTAEVGTLSISNDKGSTPAMLNTGGLAQYTYAGGINFSTSPYKQDSEATVTLSGLDTNKWHIVGEFCQPAGRQVTTQGCPGPKSAVYYRNEPDGIIKGFRINCGVDITYGWVVSDTQTLASKSSYQMSVWDSQKPDDTCFISADTKTGLYRSIKPHCRALNCTQSTSSAINSSLIVDYSNISTQPIATMQWQTNTCQGKIHGELSGANNNECMEYPYRDFISSLPERTLAAGKTLRCFWQNAGLSNQKPACRILTPSDDVNQNTMCASEYNHPISFPTSTIPSLQPSNQPNSITPPKGLPTFVPTQIPVPTLGTQYSVKPEDLGIFWDFTNTITDLVDPKDTRIIGLKIGICDDPDGANYNRKTKRAGGKGPLCKWYDTYRTAKELTRKDTPKGSTQLTESIQTDFNNNPLDTSKNYYLTCQYYVVRNGIFGSNYTAFDAWRRCKPMKVIPNQKLIFSNILSPAQYIDNIPEEVPLSDGISLMIPPKTGSIIIPVRFNFDSKQLVDNPRIIEDVHYFRLGICNDVPLTELQNGNKNCTFFDTIDRLSEKKGETHEALYTTGPDNKPLEAGKAYYITCQYKILDIPTIVDRTTRRCNPRRVIANQTYSPSPAWQYFNAYEDSFKLPNDGEGFIPLSLHISSSNHADIKQVQYTVCSKDTNNKESCTKKVESPITSGNSILTSNTTILPSSSQSQVKEYTVSCNLISTNGSASSCGQKTMQDPSATSFTVGPNLHQHSVTTATEKCDSNADGVCNGLDVAKCYANKTISLCDLNNDQIVNAADYSLLKSELGKKR